MATTDAGSPAGSATGRRPSKIALLRSASKDFNLKDALTDSPPGGLYRKRSHSGQNLNLLGMSGGGIERKPSD